MKVADYLILKVVLWEEILAESKEINRELLRVIKWFFKLLDSCSCCSGDVLRGCRD